MALDNTVLDALLAAGADAAAIVAAVKAQAELDNARRAKAAEAKRSYRQRLRQEVQVSSSPPKSDGLDETSKDLTGLFQTDLSPIKESPHTPKKINPSPSSLRSEQSSARAELWLRFWAAFPKKPGNPKQPAEEKFFRLLKSGVEGETMIAGAERYAASRIGADPQFTCSAVVFLNQGRWKDDFTPAVAASTTQPRAGPTRSADSIEAGNRVLAELRAKREQAHQPRPDWDGPEIYPPAAALPFR